MDVEIESIPDDITSRIVEFDQSILDRLSNNVLSNTIKTYLRRVHEQPERETAGETKGIQLGAGVTMVDGKEKVIITISDRGVGFPKAWIENTQTGETAFEPGKSGFRGSGEIVSGTGVGMAGVGADVSLFKGSLDGNSLIINGQVVGAIISLTLPLLPSNPTPQSNL